MINKIIIIVIVFLFVNLITIYSETKAPEYIRSNGLNLFRSGDYKNSVNYCLKILNNYPVDIDLLLLLATSYECLGESHKAENKYLEILKLYPENKEIKKRLGNFYYNCIYKAINNNNYDLALNIVKNGEFYLPDNYSFYDLDAEINIKIANYKEAIHCLELSWEKNPEPMEEKLKNDVWKLQQINKCYKFMDKKSYKEWMKYLTGLEKKYPENKELMVMIADIYFNNNEEPDKRNALRNKALKLYIKENGELPKLTVGFPLAGKWAVTSGNFEYRLDTHNGYDGYCFDFVKIDNSGNRLISGNGKYNSDYFSYGENVYAVLDGIVESVTDGIGENQVGTPGSSAGNCVKIKHILNGVPYYSFYLHFKAGSIKVKPGDYIIKGDLLGQVGNSGYSFAPHLHFGVFDRNNISVPLNFILTNDSKQIVLSTPKRSQMINNE